MLQIWWLYDFYFLARSYIVAKPYINTYGLATIYAHTRKEKSVTKFAAFVRIVCHTVYAYKIL